MDIIKVTHAWSRGEVEKDTDYLYIFTDNLMRTSGGCLVSHLSSYYKRWNGTRFCNTFDLFYPKSSQAVIRGLENAYPLTTMPNPYKYQFTRRHAVILDQLWEEELQDIVTASKNYKGIKIANAQFGNGTYSKLIDVPELFDILNDKLMKYLNYDNTIKEDE